MLALLGLLSGLAGPIATVAGKIADLKAARIAADGDTAKAVIDERIQALHDRQAVLVAEAGSRINGAMRALLALGPTVYLGKVFLFDKVLGSFLGYTKDVFTTDALDPNLWWVVISVIGFYFLSTWRK